MSMLDAYKGSPEQVANDEPTEDNQRRWLESGKGWSDFIFACYRLKRQDTRVKRLSIRVGWTEGSDSLVTIVADAEQGPVVAFHGAESPDRLWNRLARRMLADSLSWKEDQYA